MKKIIIIAALMFSHYAVSAKHYPEGTIKSLSVYSASQGIDGGLFTISGFEDAGDCAKDSSGHVYVSLLSDKQGQFQLSVVLAAQVAGRIVKIKINDDSKNSTGQCLLSYITLK